ncbi:tRNA pseudouridine38-40 synthase [Aequitasia blattaphilus]|uniref:tRNA pseudouridine synthase A n=1 Tax=Aequitasia blattaphilus TaxID=2949332 RepID=A0ABT1EAK2_9FIRM|nr:tRNA pseudouridine(38-40) synthase TruA [Aequitasia blattaphilus]MCP1102837.1 tRNA pseudouridine(38-40) synthase TruA [Aequitasia blattaphilus]MCR8615477.1 tRNA pseudouridine(38-40) synthase TruA [Aequitasia blattaphilus]
MRRIKLIIAYDGTNYCGWQIQKNGITVEEILNKTIGKLTGEDIHIIGASRTDSGVHAHGQVGVFDTESTIPGERFSYAINQKLPEDIVILTSEEVDAAWHPRYQNEIRKTYIYNIHNEKREDPLKRLYAAHVSFDLDVEKMQKGAEYLLGEQDFASFCNIKSQVENTVRTIYRLQVERNGTDIQITVEGNGFLYNMVRIIAGVLIRVGRGFYTPEKVKEILEKKERTQEGITAPAKGLILEGIHYGK